MMRGMYSQGPAWYRFERDAPGGNVQSEILVPCGLLSLGVGAWPPEAPTHHASDGMPWAWADYDGDGLMSPAEFVNETVAHKARPYWNVWGSSTASDGSLWLVSEDPWMRAYAAVWNASTGCLSYDWADPIVNLSTALPPFERMERVLYQPETDTLFVSGFTAAESDWDNVWGETGRVMQRYDGFLHGARTPGASWLLPWTNHSCPGVCSVDNAKSLAVVDDVVALVVGTSATVYIYNATTGAQLRTMDGECPSRGESPAGAHPLPHPQPNQPSHQIHPRTVARGGAAMGNYSGWIDTPFGLTLSRVNPAAPVGTAKQYIVCVEEDGRLKIVTYRFAAGVVA